MSPEQANFQVTDKRSDLFSVGVVLAALLLGRNVFKGTSPEESRKNIMHLPIPDFRKLDGRIDDRLNEILNRTLAREIDARYPNAEELLYDLEHYIYHSGYGPTNETMGKLMRELFGQHLQGSLGDAKGSTHLLERSARSTRMNKSK
jgi:serine/threonine-protein kinase